MKKNIIKNVGLMLLSVLLTACHIKYTSNGENQYLKSRNGVDIVVPPPLTPNDMSHFYDLPPQQQNAQITIEPPNSANEHVETSKA